MFRILCSLVLCMVVGVANAQVAGHAILVIGEVSVMRNGVEIPLSRNAEIRSGDFIRTGVASNAQLRMEDNAVIALRPRTELRIDEFRYRGKEDGSERAFYSLVKGGFRTVTGLIGKLNPGNYKVTSPTLAIGIRGTNFTLVHCQDDCGSARTTNPAASLDLAQGQSGKQAGGSMIQNGTYGAVLEGRIDVTNDSKTAQQFGAGEFFYVADNRTPAQKLILPPDFVHDRLEGQSRAPQRGPAQQEGRDQAGGGEIPQRVQQAFPPQAAPLRAAPQLVAEYRVADQLSPEGNSLLIPVEAAVARADGVYPSGTNLWFMSAEYNPSSGGHNAFNAISGGVTINTDVSGILGISDVANIYSRNNATVAESGADGGVIAWSRWTEGTPTLSGWGNQTLAANQGFHLVAGDLSASLPQQNSVSYSLIGATQPTETRAGALGGWGVTSGTITANFLAATLTGNLGLSLSRTGEQGTFAMNFSGAAATGLNSVISTVTRTAGTAALCVTGCAGSGTLMFVGPNATNAGMIYEFNAGSYYVQGAAAFKR